MHDIAEFLKEHEPFGGLDEAALDELAARVEVEFFTAGTTIFKQGEHPQDEVRVVRRGAVELVDHGRVLDLLGEGELFGHPSMVTHLPTGFEARAHEDTLSYAIASADALPLLAGPTGLEYLARSLLARPKPGPVVAADVSGFDLAQQPVRALLRTEPVICEPETSIRAAAQRMAESGKSSALVRLAEGEFGIVTDQDLRTRVVAKGRSVDDPLRSVMTTPIASVAPGQNASDVLLLMLERGIRHVPVLSGRDEVLGVISDVDLLAAETRTPFVLRRAVAEAKDVEELRRAARRLTPTLIGLHQADMAARQVSAVISVVLDALVQRTIELASAAAGPPPAEFAWLSLGSQGRREAVPSSDIDSGMVWADSEDDPSAYMRAIAAEVDRMMAAVGWEPDENAVTASGALFAHSVAEWQEIIDGWLDDPGATQVAMALSIVIDSRVIHGPDRAFGALSQLQGIRERPRVLPLLLRLALASKPPTGFRRDIVVEGSGEHRGSFDIKRGCLLPIVDIARYAGLAAGTTLTSTPERLQAAAAERILAEDEAQTLEEAHELFAALRLKHQVRQLDAGKRPDDHVDPRTLNPLTRRYLRDAFRAVASVQKRLGGKLAWGG